MDTSASNKKAYIHQILIYITLSTGLMLFYTLWDNPTIGLIVSLTLFFILLDQKRIQIFKELSHFRLSYLWYLLPVLLEWFIALPIQFWLLGNSNWATITNSGTQSVLKNILVQLLSNFREEIATSFCWLVIAISVMHLLKVHRLEKSHLKIAIVFMSILFALLHLPNAIILATHPAINLATKIFGAVLVMVNAFILGLYFKTVYIQTRSIQTVLIVHFTCGLRRSLFPITHPNLGLISLQQIGIEALILTLYLAATVIIWQKKWEMVPLNQIYKNITQDPNQPQ